MVLGQTWEADQADMPTQFGRGGPQHLPHHQLIVKFWPNWGVGTAKAGAETSNS
jgi:hypothetical protein